MLCPPAGTRSLCRLVHSALESLSTVGTVDVVRAGPDENSGYTWSVTFLTELGDVEALIVDDLDLLGTVATGEVSEFLPGITPPFDSLDPANGLPLGSTTITNVDSLSFTTLGLEHNPICEEGGVAMAAAGQVPGLCSSCWRRWYQATGHARAWTVLPGSLSWLPGRSPANQKPGTYLSVV